MQAGSISIRIRGDKVEVPSAHVGNATLITVGRWLKTARLFDEELIEQADFPDPLRLIEAYRQSGLRADVLTFSERAGMPAPPQACPYEWDNTAVVPTLSYADWWKGLPQESRKNVRLAGKRGVIVKAVDFDDALVEGIRKIYGEVEIRQGRRFWHYRKSFARVKEENATYIERSQFIGAYLEEELVGFIKYIRVDRTAVLIQILAMQAHRDKRVTNALLTHAMKLCAEQGIAELTYGKFIYGINNESSLTGFKKRNGFEQHDYRRYFVPLTLKGRVAVTTGLHLGFWNVMPSTVTTFLYNLRSRFLRLWHTKIKSISV